MSCLISQFVSGSRGNRTQTPRLQRPIPLPFITPPTHTHTLHPTPAIPQPQLFLSPSVLSGTKSKPLTMMVNIQIPETPSQPINHGL